MTNVDWSLLPALTALLEESSVSRAAERVGVTVPSMSRMLGRLRVSLGDELLVRAGRDLVRTPFAESLRERAARITGEAREVLTGGEARSLVTVVRTLTIRSNDAVVGPWLDALLTKIRASAPQVTLAFVSEGEERDDELRDGKVDLDIGVMGADAAPELRSQLLARDRFVGLVRKGHPLLRRRFGPERLGAFEHIGISRQGRLRGPIDVALERLSLSRTVVAAVPSATAAALVVAHSDRITAVPGLVALGLERLLPVQSFGLPLELPSLSLAQTWHPRLDRDAVHRLLRSVVASELRPLQKGKVGGHTP